MALTPMSERYLRPAWVRRLNAMATAAGGAAAVVPLGPDELIEEARRSTGLEDAAGDIGDGDWEGRFRDLVAAVDASDMHVTGRLMTREELLRCLRTRLTLVERRRSEPAIADESVEGPVVVTGPARSGTTILFELLALDPDLRVPVAADVMHPGLLGSVTFEERLAMCESEQELWEDVQPEFATMHELRSDLPVECVTIAEPSFAGNHWPMILQDLGDWVPDPAADLAFHRSLLQAVQFGRPSGQWLLKTPAYLMMLDELLEAYPDARIVQTHRDPARTMPSTVSTTAMVQWIRTDAVDLELLSPLIGAVFTDALATVARRRAAGEWSGSFADVRYLDLMADPVEAIEGAYARIGRPLLEEHARAIEAYLADKPRAKHGVHRYTAADWGFDPDAVRSALAEVIDRFGIELEPGA